MKAPTRRDWWMPSTVCNDDFRKSRSATLHIKNATEDEALLRALAYVQSNIQKLGKDEVFLPGILFPLALPEEEFIRAEDMLRIRARYSDRQLLRIRNPRTCFVKGYGPEAHKEVHGY